MPDLAMSNRHDRQTGMDRSFAGQSKWQDLIPVVQTNPRVVAAEKFALG
jgi:hypothetical protein